MCFRELRATAHSQGHSFCQQRCNFSFDELSSLLVFINYRLPPIRVASALFSFLFFFFCQHPQCALGSSPTFTHFDIFFLVLERPRLDTADCPAVIWVSQGPKYVIVAVAQTRVQVFSSKLVCLQEFMQTLHSWLFSGFCPHFVHTSSIFFWNQFSLSGTCAHLFIVPVASTHPACSVVPSWQFTRYLLLESCLLTFVYFCFCTDLGSLVLKHSYPRHLSGPSCLPSKSRNAFIKAPSSRLGAIYMSKQFYEVTF